jgi:hypothetical protein
MKQVRRIFRFRIKIIRQMIGWTLMFQDSIELLGYVGYPDAFNITGGSEEGLFGV